MPKKQMKILDQFLQKIRLKHYTVYMGWDYGFRN